MKAILFDAGNTLVWLDHEFLIELLREHGVEATDEELFAAQYGGKLLLDELVRGGGGGDDAARAKVFFGEVFRQLGVAAELYPALARRLFERHAVRNLWSRVRGKTAETLDELLRRGWRLGVVSNADGRVEALLTEVGLRNRFELVIDSGVVGVEKPDPRIFRMACDRLGVEPREAVFVGDVYEIDVVGARSAGMRAILVDPLMRLDQLDCERIAAIDALPDLLGEAS